jgi:transcriptional regulator with XRE-family HTH domain/mannose-6-phosphate isomerase-like protein (cupin superfamily)
MSGELEYNCDGESPNISAGHGVFVPYMTGRSLSNAGGSPAEILWIAKSRIEESGQPGESVENEVEAKPGLEPPSEMEDIHSEPAMSFAGGNIRKLRMERGMTVASLAKEIDMTPAYVSRVERGLVEPSLPVLRNITDALDVEMIYLFSVPFTGDIKVSNIFDRADEIVIPGDNAIIQLLTPPKLANGDKPHLFVIGIRLEGGQVDCEEFVVHNFVEFTYVVEGEVEYVTDSGSYLCKTGDAIYIKRNVPHQLHNPGEKDCKLITALGNIAHNYVQETSKGINA